MGISPLVKEDHATIDEFASRRRGLEAATS
jgi:hypothetical protein